MPITSTLSILDLRGGQNDTDSPIALAANEVTDNRNIDWSKGQIAHKRAGTVAIDITDSVFATRPPSPDVTTASQAASGTSLSFTHAGSSGNSPKLLLAISVDTSSVTAVTYNAVAMTLVASGTDGVFTVYVYTATALTTSATIAITTAGAATIVAHAHTFINCTLVSAGAGVAYGAGNSLRTTTGLTGSGFGRNVRFSAFATGGGIYRGAGPGQRVLAKASISRGLMTSYEINRRIVGPSHSIEVVQHVQGDTASAAVVVHALLTGLVTSEVPAGEAGGAIVGLWRHTPTDDHADDELFALDEYGRLDRYVDGAWSAEVANCGLTYASKYVGGFDSGADRYYVNGTSLHGKFFLTVRSAPFGYDENFTTAVTGNASPFTAALAPTFYKDRVLVWDGTSMRLAGLDAPRDAPSAADSGGAGALTGARQYRYRYVMRDSNSVVILRSEPSAAVSITPSGANASITVTKEAARLFYDVGTTPAAAFVKATNGETHWEVEESVDAGVTFYRIATVAVATLTYADSLTTAQVTTTGTLSEAAGEYTPLRSARHVAVDDDRILIGGSKALDSLSGAVVGRDSGVAWTPVDADDGVGNDERLAVTLGSFIDLDGNQGGNIRAMVAGEHGVVHVFKRNRFYRLLRTGNVASAYDSIMESRVHGALMNCATPGYDAAGNVSVYAVDPTVGLYRLGTSGTEILMDRKVRVTWRTRNKAVDPVRLLYYHDLGQVWVWAALSAATVPDRVFVYDRRLSAFSFHDGNLAAILSATNFPDSTGELRPTLGSSRLNAIQVADSGVSDDGTYYRSYVTTKPFPVGNLLAQFGVLSPPGAFVHALAMGVAAQAITSITRASTTATVTTTAPHGFSTGDYITIADAVPTDYNGLYEITSTGASTFTYTVAGSPATPATTPGTAQKVTTLNVKVIRDLGLETANFTTSLNPTASETYVTKKLDDVAMSEARVLQFEIGDPPSYTLAKLAQTWTVDALVVQFTVGGA